MPTYAERIIPITGLFRSEALKAMQGTSPDPMAADEKQSDLEQAPAPDAAIAQPSYGSQGYRFQTIQSGAHMYRAMIDIASGREMITTPLKPSAMGNTISIDRMLQRRAGVE